MQLIVFKTDVEEVRQVCFRFTVELVLVREAHNDCDTTPRGPSRPVSFGSK